MLAGSHTKRPQMSDDQVFDLLEVGLEEWNKGKGTHEIAAIATREMGRLVTESDVYNLLAAARDPG
jgi:hypothetical protein